MMQTTTKLTAQPWTALAVVVGVLLGVLIAPQAHGRVSSAAAGDRSGARSRGLPAGMQVARKPSRKQAKQMYRAAVRRTGGSRSELCGARVASRRVQGTRWGRVISRLLHPCRGYIYLLVKPRGKAWRWQQSLGSEWPHAPWSCDSAEGVPDRVLRELTGYTCKDGGKPRRV